MQPRATVCCPTAWRWSELIDTPTSALDLDTAAKKQSQDLADVERVLAGNVQAFEGIVRRWQGPLVNMAWRYCRDRERAEELAQEAFVRAWRGLAGWRHEGSFSTWLFALAANVFRSELKRFPTLNVPLEEMDEPSAPAAQHQALAAQLSSETVRRAVLSLPVRYREPVVLFYFHEMDVAAAARTMKLPEGTVKARLSRARELLRRRFPGLEAEQGSHSSVAAATAKDGAPGGRIEVAHDAGKEV
jgi:RNA polymerase sigma-70 factor (ECF subfamily)